MITLINGAWHFGEAAWDFSLNRSSARSYAFSRLQLRRGHRIRPFRNHVTANNTGQIIAPHLQGLIPGVKPGLRARCAPLAPGLGGADPLVVCLPSGRMRVGLPVRSATWSSRRTRTVCTRISTVVFIIRGRSSRSNATNICSPICCPTITPIWCCPVGRAWRCCARRGRLRIHLSVVPGGDWLGRAGRWRGSPMVVASR